MGVTAQSRFELLTSIIRNKGKLVQTRIETFPACRQADTRIARTMVSNNRFPTPKTRGLVMMALNDLICLVKYSGLRPYQCSQCREDGFGSGQHGKLLSLDASYQKQKRGRDPPIKDDYMFGYYAWGYPLYYPGLFYAPYMAPITISGEMYLTRLACQQHKGQRATVAKERVVLAWQQAAVAAALLVRVLEGLQASSLNEML
ncbi:hypothetical protein V1522DRAFT_230503 [Lipomyces starkeyi]